MQIQRENEQLQKSIESLLQEIEKQKDLNIQHENEIGTLLNFNERLLQIIEKEVNNANKDNNSLQPISQRSERQSDLFAPAMQSLVGKRFADTSKSEKGYNTTQSLITKNTATATNNKIHQLKMEKHQSQVNFDDTDSMQVRSIEIKPQPNPQTEKVFEQKNKVKEEMNHQIKQLQAFRDKSNKFYEDKIKQVRALGDKMKNQYKPQQQLSKITQKLNLSNATQSMLLKVVNKANQ